VADPSALYLISSGGNDATYASKFISGMGAQHAYLDTQAAPPRRRVRFFAPFTSTDRQRILA
jgi:hypothetical protein